MLVIGPLCARGDHRFGFTDAWTITTAEGDTFPAFMAVELAPGGLSGIAGRLLESPVLTTDAAVIDAFDAQHPPTVKQVREWSRGELRCPGWRSDRGRGASVSWPAGWGGA